jgi:hypothetical protein
MKIISNHMVFMFSILKTLKTTSCFPKLENSFSVQFTKQFFIMKKSEIFLFQNKNMFFQRKIN